MPVTSNIILLEVVTKYISIGTVDGVELIGCGQRWTRWLIGGISDRPPVFVSAPYTSLHHSHTQHSFITSYHKDIRRNMPCIMYRRQELEGAGVLSQHAL